MTEEERATLTTLSAILVLGGVGAVIYYLIKKEGATSSGPVGVKVSSKCDTATTAELTLSWSAYSGAASYNILHLNQSTPVAHTTATQFKIDSSVVPGFQLGYETIAIQALDASGNVLATGPYVKFTVCSMPGDPCYPDFKC
jgi:hypothetical protein